MPWFSSLGRTAGRATEDIKPVTVRPTEIPEVPEVPSLPTKIADPIVVKPTGGSGAVGAAGVALGGVGFILPSILNSNAVTGAIAGAAQIGTASVLGNDAAGVANNLISAVTATPADTAVFLAAIGSGLYLLIR